MKRLFLAILATMMMFTSVSAQRLAGVRAEASFITDRMVAELGLSSAQRGSVLNINLAYLNGINSYRDIDSYLSRIHISEPRGQAATSYAVFCLRRNNR